ncbi:hypothetical protein CARUB_v10018020mg [Capsella rubella]|uniref:Uncharacterized protein n=1 Tax=Capsella rubella TaxID=81985 RepID=R0HLD4_9BRAS|nr:uncharacterized protein LOC17884990 [Capsella rubella]EOA24743.1 hypothetical protein CARUB_v10018020mg [Capsella rubella]
MLPTRFCNPLWFSDSEILELKGTNLYHATELQKKKLMSLYHGKVEALVKKLLLLDGDSESLWCSEVSFEHFLWANSVFWSRALNIPLPHSFVFPQSQEDDPSTSHTPETDPVNSNGGKEIFRLKSLALHLPDPEILCGLRDLFPALIFVTMIYANNSNIIISIIVLHKRVGLFVTTSSYNMSKAFLFIVIRIYIQFYGKESKEKENPIRII